MVLQKRYAKIDLSPPWVVKELKKTANLQLLQVKAFHNTAMFFPSSMFENLSGKSFHSESISSKLISSISYLNSLLFYSCSLNIIQNRMLFSIYLFLFLRCSWIIWPRVGDGFTGSNAQVFMSLLHKATSKQHSSIWKDHAFCYHVWEVQVHAHWKTSWD